MTVALLVSYDGTHFSGYQRQAKGERTVQGVLESAALALFGAPTRVTASGRTDAGVHAAGQVCGLTAETAIPAEKLRECFNRLLPPDVRVLRSAAAPEGFDVSRAAKKKTYRYRAYFAASELPLLSRYAARLRERPDLAKMRGAADLLQGEHDFLAFSSTGSSAKTSVRTLYAVEISEETQNGHTMYEVEVTGSGFLYNMVRILSGEIFAVGCGKNPEDIPRAFETGARSCLAGTMPACGLTLVRVDYGFPLFGEE